MSQEDDLRGLAKVMDFMRALSVLFVIVNVYWFCYPSMKEWNIDIGVVDRILLNFQRTTGLFSSILWTKLFALVFLALSCLGTKGVKEEKSGGRISGRRLPPASCCSSSTGGCLICRCPFRRVPVSICSPCPQGTAASWLPGYGCPACSGRT